MSYQNINNIRRINSYNVILCSGYAAYGAGFPCPTFIAHYIRKRSADAEPQVQIDNDPGK
jgi:hypothetical protein